MTREERREWEKFKAYMEAQAASHGKNRETAKLLLGAMVWHEKEIVELQKRNEALHQALLTVDES